jgi:hypothetical protein
MCRVGGNGTIREAMARQRCTSCSKSIPASAKFCPRCGRETGAAAGHGHDVLPSSSPVPLAGILFIAAAVLGPTLIAAGIYTAAPVLLYGGIAVAVCLILLLVLGLFF